MAQLFDLDVRVLAPIGWPRSPEAVLGDIACAARVARLRGIDAIGAVGRFSSLRGPGVLEALRDAAGEGGLFRPPGRAAVVAGGALSTEEGVQLVIYGTPGCLLELARSFERSLFAGHVPPLGQALAEARRLGLVAAARSEGRTRDERLAMLRRDLDGAVALLSVGATPAPVSLAEYLRAPVLEGSGALSLEAIGARATSLEVEGTSFDAFREAVGRRETHGEPRAPRLPGFPIRSGSSTRARTSPGSRPSP